MRNPSLVVVVIALVAVAFGAGYWLRDSRGPSRAEMEDYALMNILEGVSYAAFLAKGDATQARELLDIYLNTHIARVRGYQGSANDSGFIASKIRTLNAVARLWEQHPPLSASAHATSDAAKAIWLTEWKETTAENAKLVEWAKSQCATTPALQCATGSLGR